MEKRGSYGKPKNDMSKAKQSDIKREAVKHILNDFLDGAQHSTIVSRLQEDAYDIGFKYTKYSAQKLIDEARKQIVADYKQEIATLRERFVAMYMDIFTEAKQCGQYQASLKAMEQMTKLLGLNEPDRQEVTFKDITIDFGFDEG